MTDAKKLKPAAEMVRANDAHDLNESKEYRRARDALLSFRSWASFALTISAAGLSFFASVMVVSGFEC